ncbi:MAG: tRNA uridine-5-carboxymethylaminomethyl(34) synthesis GTPase MnmE [Deltaproteobacteria bacterium]|jgi:tRNA modification GTPase|nr:tRNA uridine-5-carboxymethylaminomethyl(34) synthesis GTPase MnmE [Deltaproteobacteria bacterium]
MTISNEDTICAIATPPGQGGIGVVRVSGPNARMILSSLWMGQKPCDDFEPRKLYLGEVSVSGDVVDRVMAVIMPAPHTYTGQDIVEFSCHGSPIVLNKLLGGCVSVGARVAAPGEFTRRSFLSGKCDLAQAEAVAELIHATSEKAAKRAAEQLSGKLSNEVISIGDDLAELRKFVEASIDFPEEDIDFIKDAGIIDKLSKVSDRISHLLSTFDEGRLLAEGIRTAIVGKPNVGKSSLFNRLVGDDRAIVHHTPGTTRDMVEANVNFGGYTFHLRDTAGLRDSDCEIEGLGVARSRGEIERADLILALFDSSLSLNEDDRSFIEDLDPKRTILVINKVDLKRELEISDMNDFSSVEISSKNGRNIDQLEAAMIGRVISDVGLEEGAVVMSGRHKESLDNALRHLGEAECMLRNSDPMEIVAQRLGIAQESLGMITGAVTNDDLLDRIFSTFCIGK